MDCYRFPSNFPPQLQDKIWDKKHLDSYPAGRVHLRYCHSDITSTRFQGNIVCAITDTKSGIEILGIASCTAGRPVALLGVQLLLGISLTVDKGLQVLLVLVF